MTAIAQSAPDRSLLRRALQIDAVLCAAGGTGLVALAGPVASLTGLASEAVLPLGLFLLGWGAWIGYASTRPTLSRRAAQAVMAVNFAWVALSAAALIFGWLPLTAAGFWIVVAQAIVVDLFAVAQLLGLRRAR